MSAAPIFGSLPEGGAYTDSSDSVVIVFDGLGDTTRRPRRPNIPREWTRPASAAQPPSTGQPPTGQPSS